MGITERPESLVLSPQALPTLDRGRYASAGVAARGAMVLADAGRRQALCAGAGDWQ
ncbi:hypothetical protein [Variovorax sp. JS1663]|uniref:hypothetical protein n=1 Tax=Variovorax sp. JS1663 TaxID=1851577 RepID=UPI003FD30B5A